MDLGTTAITTRHLLMVCLCGQLLVRALGDDFLLLDQADECPETDRVHVLALRLDKAKHLTASWVSKRIPAGAPAM